MQSAVMLCLPAVTRHNLVTNEVKDNIGQNTTGLLAGCSYGVNETTCFGLLGGRHQIYKC